MTDAYDEETREHAGRVTAGLASLLGVTFLAFINYAALLPVTPMWAARGGAAGAAVGATTGAMMAATVVTQTGMPWLLRILRLRDLMLAGLILLGGPAPLYLLSTDLAPIMTITVLRGIGFALVVTAGATLVADLAGAGRLASSASLYGVAAALPNLGALAGGVWATEELGYESVFWVSGAACLAAAVIASTLPNHRGSFRLGQVGGVRHAVVPLTLFVLTAGAFGAVTTFLPLSGPSPGTSAFALLAPSAALVLGRLVAGFFADHYGTGRLLFIAVGASAVGTALMALSLDRSPATLVIGASLLGGGFGASQNDSFVATIERLGRDNSGAAGTVWNAAYDGGLGAGAVVLGGVVGHFGYAAGFATMAGTMAAVAIVLWPLRRSGWNASHN